MTAQTPTPTTGDASTTPKGFNVQIFVDAAQAKKDLAFSENDLTSAMMQQASMFAHYGVLFASASKQADTVKMLLESTEAAIYNQLRHDALVSGDKMTENQLDKAVARHPRVSAMKQSLNEARRVESVAKMAVEAFRHRRDMLVQMGLLSRDERKGELYLKAREDAQSTIKNDVLARRQVRQEE